jgi:hypothetical protein
MLRHLLPAAACVVILALGGSARAEPASGDPLRLCFFSMNSRRELRKVQQYVRTLNAAGGRAIEVREFLADGEPAETAFLRMVSSGTRCDGLVLSGHHTGRWGGARASRSLRLEFMESLSCDPRYASWFRAVQSVWLQGCRTLGAEEVIPARVGRARGERSPDYHTWRVIVDIEGHMVGENMFALNRTFTQTVHARQATRYRTLFPSATVQGWTYAAVSNNPVPGEPDYGRRVPVHEDRWNAEYSLPWQMAFAAESRLGYPVVGDDPVSPGTRDVDAETGAQALRATFEQMLSTAAPGSRKPIEPTAIAAWERLGRDSQNPSTRALPRWVGQPDQELDAARRDACTLLDAPDAARKLSAATALASDARRLEFAFDKVWAYRQRVLQESQRSGDPRAIEAFDRALSSRSAWISQVRKAARTPETGILDRLDHYSYLRGVTDPAALEDLRELLRAQLRTELRQPVDAGEADQERRYQDYLARYARALGVIDAEWLRDLEERAQ